MAEDQEKRIKGKGLFSAPTVEEMTDHADKYYNMVMSELFGPKMPGGGRGNTKRKKEALGSGKAREAAEYVDK
jgi:hypothetical protein